MELINVWRSCWKTFSKVKRTNRCKTCSECDGWDLKYVHAKKNASEKKYTFQKIWLYSGKYVHVKKLRTEKKHIFEICTFFLLCTWKNMHTHFRSSTSANGFWNDSSWWNFHSRSVPTWKEPKVIKNIRTGIYNYLNNSIFEIRRVYSSRTLSTFCELIFQFEHLARVRQPTKSKVRQ